MLEAEAVAAVQRTHELHRPAGCVAGAAGQQEHRCRRVGAEEAGSSRRGEDGLDGLVGSGRDDSVAGLEEGVQRDVGRQLVADVGEPRVVEVHRLDGHRFVVCVAQPLDADDRRPGVDVELLGDLGLGIDDGDVDDLRSGASALGLHGAGIRRQSHRLGHLRRSHERPTALLADDPALDGEVVERLAHGRARHVELLAERPLRRYRRSRRHPIDLRPQPLAQLVVLRCSGLHDYFDDPAIADGLGGRGVVAFDGQ